ncbi:MAG: glycosyltransferase [Candidatus Levybacteria bacterium]|nr:glycosyltransferase [Candidatus Levybacteria bacterium]
MRVDIVIPNFNGSHLIEKNLPSVLTAIDEYQGKVIIIDDGSEISDKQNLRKIVKEQNEGKIILQEHVHNKGFSSAVNTGVRLSNADFVVLLNSDVVPRSDFLKDPLRRLGRDENLFAVGCMDESIEDDKKVYRGRGIARWSKGMLHHARGEVNSEDTFWVSGGSSVFRRSLYLKLDGMDEIYNPFYWEDIDLSYRAQKSGYTIIFDSKSIVTHYHEKGAIKTNFTSSQITTTAYRNQFIFIWKNITTLRLMLSHIFYLPINILLALKGGDTNMINGLFLAMALLPAIIDKRKKQRELYKISDLEVIKNIS